MTTARAFLAPAVTALSLLAGCSASAPHRPEPQTAAAQAPAPRPILTQSLYARDASGALSESDLQRVLEAPIDLQFPARVGVVPLAQPFDPEGQVSLATRSVASRDLARALTGHPHFSHVSDISTELPNVGGIEGLRTIAARYRLRYLLLYSERFEDASHLNGWAFLYPTLIGMFVAPGVTVKSRGLSQVDLLDVRTGTILFSVVEPMQVEQKSFMIGAERSHRELEMEATATAAKALAKRVSTQTHELVAFADLSARGAQPTRPRILPAPIMVGSAASVESVSASGEPGGPAATAP
ncbi:hypothetical protein [Chondromyces crocatus]|uniref:Lipoprotein n=1 Tax=Chondromyces crocatus TaxID=52 RepID=A0A0K1E8C1_CHOCO|nr:hypothetical protein [Chondromyces crocatus]AKT36833.1 uncharacterized protein CMC5_009540 [Chondromyces crocatus]